MLFKNSWAQTFFPKSINVLHLDSKLPSGHVLGTHYYINSKPWFDQLIFTSKFEELKHIINSRDVSSSSLILVKDEKGIHFIKHPNKKQAPEVHFSLKAEEISADKFPASGFRISEDLSELPYQYSRSSIIKVEGDDFEHFAWDDRTYAEVIKILDEGRLVSLILSPQEWKLFDQEHPQSWKFIETFILGFNPKSAKLKDWDFYFVFLGFLVTPLKNLIRLTTEYLLCVIKLSLETQEANLKAAHPVVATILQGFLKLVNLLYFITRLILSPIQLLAEWQFKDGKALPEWPETLISLATAAQIGAMFGLAFILPELLPAYLFIPLGIALLGQAWSLLSKLRTYSGDMTKVLTEDCEEENLTHGLNLALVALQSKSESCPVLVYPNTRLEILADLQAQWTTSPPIGPLSPNTWYFYRKLAQTIHGSNQCPEQVANSEIWVYPNEKGDYLHMRSQRYDEFSHKYNQHDEFIGGLEGVFHGKYSYVFQDKKPSQLEAETVYIYPSEDGLHCIGITTNSRTYKKEKITNINLERFIRDGIKDQWKCLMTDARGRMKEGFCLSDKLPGRELSVNSDSKLEVKRPASLFSQLRAR